MCQSSHRISSQETLTMRARNIKPGFFKNDELAEIGPCAQLLFAGLWCMADKEGKLSDRPKRIRAEIFPYYEPKPGIIKILDELDKKNFITRYSVNGHRIIKIVNFLEHQSPHHTEKASNLPDLQEGGDITVNSPLSNGEYPPDSLIPDSLIPDSLIKDSRPKKIVFNPDDFQISENVRNWAESNGHKQLEEHRQGFIDYLKSSGKKYKDYDAAFRRAISQNWGKIDLGRQSKVNEPKGYAGIREFLKEG